MDTNDYLAHTEKALSREKKRWREGGKESEREREREEKSRRTKKKMPKRRRK
jgi:hypothetical protein